MLLFEGGFSGKSRPSSHRSAKEEIVFLIMDEVNEMRGSGSVNERPKH